MKKAEGLTAQPWQEPELTYVKPKLTKVGPLKEVTGEFFDSFTPPKSEDAPDPPPPAE